MCFRIVLIGRKKAGKSSLLATLRARRPVLIAIGKRTRVVDVKTLELSDEDFLEVYDQGGHAVYGITSNLFICRKCTVLLVQEVTDPDDMTEMISRLRQILHRHPDVKIHTVLTHTDKLDTASVNGNSEKIMEKLNEILKQEIENAEKYNTHSGEGQQDHLVNERAVCYPEKLMKIKNDMQLFCVSSHNFDGMIKVIEFLHQVAKEGTVNIPDPWAKLFVLISVS